MTFGPVSPWAFRTVLAAAISLAAAVVFARVFADDVRQPIAISLLQTEVRVRSRQPISSDPFASKADAVRVQLAADACSSVLGACLHVLSFVVIADGLRRWRRSTHPAADDACDGAATSRLSAEVLRSHPSSGDGWSELMQAALSSDALRFHALFDAGASTMGVDMWGSTVLHAAAKGGSTPIVETLLTQVQRDGSAGATINDLDAMDETPLHIAARAGHVGVCMLLRSHGAVIDAANAQGWTPLVLAAHEEQIAVCEALLSCGATAGGLQHEHLPQLLRLRLGADSGVCRQKTVSHKEFARHGQPFVENQRTHEQTNHATPSRNRWRTREDRQLRG